MAKISTYPADSSPSLSDYVIGTDINDSNNTKNYTLGSILALANPSLQSTYVPYTGANNNVNLGSYDLTTTGDVTAGNITISPTGSISLGTSGTVLFGTGGISMPGGSSTISIVGTLTSINSNSLNTYITQVLALNSANCPLLLNGSAGTSGEILQSNGPSNTPSWTSITSLSQRAQLIATNVVTFLVADTPQALAFSSITSTSGITLVTNGSTLTRITFAEAGTYRLSYIVQLYIGSSGNNHYLTLFLRLNGTGSGSTGNIANSTYRYLTTGNNYNIQVGDQRFITVNANDYVEVMSATSVSNQLSLNFVPAQGVAPFAPVQPTAVVTVERV